MKECCKTCKFYKAHNPFEDQFKGECRRYPPEAKKNFKVAMFPIVTESGWCGEFDHKVSHTLKTDNTQKTDKAQFILVKSNGDYDLRTV